MKYQVGRFRAPPSPTLIEFHHLPNQGAAYRTSLRVSGLDTRELRLLKKRDPSCPEPGHTGVLKVQHWLDTWNDAVCGVQLGVCPAPVARKRSSEIGIRVSQAPSTAVLGPLHPTKPSEGPPVSVQTTCRRRPAG